MRQGGQKHRRTWCSPGPKSSIAGYMSFRNFLNWSMSVYKTKIRYSDLLAQSLSINAMIFIYLFIPPHYFPCCLIYFPNFVQVSHFLTWNSSMVSSAQSHSVMSNSLWPHGLYNSPSQNTGVGSISLIQGILPTQGLNSGLPHCRQTLYWLSLSLRPNQSLIHLFWHLLCPRGQTLFSHWGLSWSQDRHKKELRYHICKLAILAFHNKFYYQYI